jgi:lysylphosphatidylglycerol synthetase-like protein (DUF2156 family)
MLGKIFGLTIVVSVITALLNPDYLLDLMNGISGLITTIMVIAIAGSIKILGSGLNDKGVDILFKTVLLLALLLRVSFSIEAIGLDIDIGIGLFTNMYNVISTIPVVGSLLGGFLVVLGLVSGAFSLITRTSF